MEWHTMNIDLMPVIQWLENGCDPKAAAKELRIYQEMNKLTDGVLVMSEATDIERERCLRAVEDEPELSGDMTDKIWELIAGDRDMMTKALRIVVRQTKTGIRDRIIGV